MTYTKQIIGMILEVKKYDDSEVIRDYESDMSLEDIRDKHGMTSVNTIYPILKRHGVIAGGRVRSSKYDEEGIIKDYVLGMKIKNIAEKYGIVNKENVYPILRKNNIIRNRPRGFERR